jgi:4-hydroxy-3-polyprenylbenzoate decarboxylase
MAYSGFQDFLSALERAGELRRVRTPVDPVLEITEIADRCVKNNGPALLFEQPTGSAFPLPSTRWRRASG